MASKSVLITGAANGIGKQLAILMAHPDTQLVLVDNDDSGSLAQTAELCGKLGSDVRSVLADVRDKKSLTDGVIAAIDVGSQFDFVFAFAGIGVLNVEGKMNSGADIMGTNFFGVVNTFDIFSLQGSPHLIAPTTKRLISVSSIGGLVATHNSGFYSASKSALMKYTDSLRLLNYSTDVEVHDIILGFVDTRMIAGLRHAKILAISDTRAARLILKACTKSRKRVHSIPRIRNLPWSLLSHFSSNLRLRLLDRIFGFVYRT
jgi:short-subunit dehydrogenase